MSQKPPDGIVGKLAKLIHAKAGPLTDQLERVPGGFGLGQVPARLAPDKTTTMVCGFCSTGCGLNVHLKDGIAINASPAPDYPVNLGKACPKGWEALSVLAGHDRARPELRHPVGHGVEERVLDILPRGVRLPGVDVAGHHGQSVDVRLDPAAGVLPAPIEADPNRLHGGPRQHGHAGPR